MHMDTDQPGTAWLHLMWFVLLGSRQLGLRFLRFLVEDRCEKSPVHVQHVLRRSIQSGR